MNQARFTRNVFLVVIGLILIAFNIVSDGLVLDVIGKMAYMALDVILPLV